MGCDGSVRVRQGGHTAVAAGGVLAGGAHHTRDELMSIGLSDCRCIDPCGVAIHTHQVVSETTTTTTTTTTLRSHFGSRQVCVAFVSSLVTDDG